ncbi:MAG: hypothetical protein JXB10_15975 [Pirellulales bacterium]|nr:hypothetical protein [Pirellulales bacterium]
MPVPPVLDDAKRRVIISMLSNGSSRRITARYVGCAQSTITRTAARDPAFAAQIAAAEHQAEIEILRALRAAARNERYWRAGAWLLERRNPEDFAARSPQVFTVDQIMQMISLLGEILYAEIPAENADRAIQKVEQFLREFNEEESNATDRCTSFSLPRPNFPLSQVQSPPNDLCEVAFSDFPVNPEFVSTFEVQQ